MNSNPTFKDRALQAAAVVGLIAILLIGAWGIIQLAFVLWGFLGNVSTDRDTNSPVATQQTEQISVSVPTASIASGSPFTVTFARTGGEGNVAYELSYSCVDGVTMQAPSPAGKTQSVSCNTPFNYTNATSNMQLTATNAGSAAASVTITVGAKNLSTGVVGAKGTGIVTILPKAKTTVKPTTNTSTSRTSSGSTYLSSGRTSNLFGQPDLMVSIGSISQTSAGRYSATFTVQNVGTNVAPAGWTFNASLPTSPTYNYNSQTQQALYPGDKIVYTLGFTMQNNYYGYNNYSYTYPYTYTNCNYTNNYTYNGAYTYPGVSYTCPANSSVYNYQTYLGYQAPSYGAVQVTVDPSNYIYENNEGNNTASSNVY